MGEGKIGAAGATLESKRSHIFCFGSGVASTKKFNFSPTRVMTQLQLRLANFLIFGDTNNTVLILRSKHDVPHIDFEWIQISIADGTVRIVNPRLDPIASAMPLITEYSTDYSQQLTRLLARLDFREFFDGLTDTSHLSGCLCAIVERSAITRCVDKGFHSHRHIWSKSLISQCVTIWFERYGQYSEARIHNHGFFGIMLNSINQINRIVDEFFIVLE
jgi:hypothetical protein